MICGATFQAPPSSKKVTCSPECRSKRASISASKPGRKWSAEAKARRAADTRIMEQLSSMQEIATAAALERPDGRRGPAHRASKIWTLIDPSGNKIVVTNLLDWSRKNYDLFEPPCDDVDAAAARISKGFQAIASSMRGVKSRKRQAYHYKGWSLDGIPSDKETPKTEHNQNNEQKPTCEQKKKSSARGRKFADITGQRFGRLIALHPTGDRSHGSVVWHCQCDCGKTTDVSSAYLLHGKTKSCGCLITKGVSHRGATPGVIYVKSRDRYNAYIVRGGRQYHLGSSPDLNEALAMRAEAEQVDYDHFDEYFAELRRKRKRR